MRDLRRIAKHHIATTRQRLQVAPLRRGLPGALLGSAVLLGAGAAVAWTPLPVTSDPLVRMPGNQQNEGILIEASSNCMNCHAGYDTAVEPGFNWKGSMMAQAARDPIFWATMTVAAQDSIWAIGRPNATDICLRCHSPAGWLGGRSDPTNGSALAGADFDGVSCDFCHSSYDPFFEDTAAGTREGSDWTGYWDETNASATQSSAFASTTLQADRTESGKARLYNGSTMYGANYHPRANTWTEAAVGQYFVSTVKNRRASFADANPKHTLYYSRFHKSRYFCATCHDVSNPVLENLPYKATLPGDGTTILPTEQNPAFSYFHVERTFSEFALSAYGQAGGADGVGPFAPTLFKTSRPGNKIATCQDCHMPDRTGVACNKTSGVLRPTDSVEHPKSGLPLHDMTGGNTLMPRLLASTIVGSPTYDAQTATLLRQGPAALTMDLTQGEPLDASALLDAANRALVELQHAAAVQIVGFVPSTGSLTLRVVNQTGHKLPSGYPEGRRMFVNIVARAGGVVVRAINPYDTTAGTLRGLDPILSPNSPPLASNEQYHDDLVYESKPRSSLTGEQHTFHFALADGRTKDNRIPPKGFRSQDASSRLAEPVWNGISTPSYFTASEYAGGYDEVTVSLPPGADSVEVRLYYQSTSREYVEFLRDEINGTGGTLASPAPSGEPAAYVAQTDPFFAALKAWGTTIWQVWDRNKNVPGAAPVLMASAQLGGPLDPCSQSGSNGASCDDGNACTTVDACLNGACVGSSPVSCAPSNQCHLAGLCDPATGQCTNPTRPNGSACNDGDLCTATDTCQTGTCVGSAPILCPVPDPCHLAGVCDPATGVCSNPDKADNASCNDGNACTTVDTCQSGACVGSVPVTCTASNECHAAGVCNTTSGVCSNPSLPDGTACAGGVCSSGACTSVDSGAPDAPPDAPAEASQDSAPDVVGDVAPDVELDVEPDSVVTEEASADGAADDASDAPTADAPGEDAFADGSLDATPDVPGDDSGPVQDALTEADAVPGDAAMDQAASPETGTGGSAPYDAAIADAREEAGVTQPDSGGVATASGEDGGCGCATPGQRSSEAGWRLLLGLAAMIAIRRARKTDLR